MTPDYTLIPRSSIRRDFWVVHLNSTPESLYLGSVGVLVPVSGSRGHGIE